MSPLRLSRETLQDLEDNLLMFFTGYSRSASAVLADQKTRTEKEDSAMLDNLHFIKELGLSARQCLESGQTEEFAKLMHQHWLHKKKRSDGISNNQISGWYDLAMANGALGGKLIGAGGGGFLLFYAKDRAGLRRVMASEQLAEVRFNFDFEGSKVMVTDYDAVTILSWIAAATLVALAGVCSFRRPLWGLYAVMASIPLSYKPELQGYPLYFLTELVLFPFVRLVLARQRHHVYALLQSPFAHLPLFWCLLQLPPYGPKTSPRWPKRSCVGGDLFFWDWPRLAGQQQKRI